jgi:hypothetical protein
MEVHKYAVKGVLGTVFKTPFILAGLISWVAILLVGITSIPQIRESFYGVFKVSSSDLCSLSDYAH